MMHAEMKPIPVWLILVIGSVALTVAMLVGIVALPWQRLLDSGCFGRGGAMQGADCNVQALWQRRVAGNELLHVLFIPYGNHRTMSGSAAYGGVARSRGIDSMPEGLFYDGKRLGPDQKFRVFVLRKDATAEGIPLTPEELRLFAPNVLNNLSMTDVWKNKIRPIVERETMEPKIRVEE